MEFRVETLFALEVVLKVTLLLGLTCLFLLVSGRLSAATRHLLGLFGLAAALGVPLLSPLLPSIPVPLVRRPLAVVPARSARPVVAAASRTKPDLTASVPAGETPSGVAAGPVDPAQAPAASPRESARPVPAASIPWGPIVGSIWALGALLALARSFAGMLRIRGIVRRATRIEQPEWLALAREVSERLSLERDVRFFHTEEIAVALTAGVRNPVVLLPEDACSWPEDRRRMVLLHELAHVKRRDCLALVVGSFATALYWFHPLLWVVSEKLRREREQASDDLVLGAGARASDYAAELLAVARSLHVASAPLPAMALAESSSLETRLRAILNPGVRRHAPSTLLAIGALALAFTFASAVAAVDPWESPETCPQSRAARLHRRAAPLAAAAELAASTEPDCEVTADSESIPCAEPAPEDAADPAEASEEAPAAEPAPAVHFASLRDLASLRQLTPNALLSRALLASRRAPKTGSEWYGRGMELHNAERYDEAVEAFQKSIELGHREGASSYNIACGYALKGDADRAFEWLDKAVAAGFEVGSYIAHDDDLDSLRDDPRFEKLKEQAHVSKTERKKNQAAAAAARLERLLSNRSADGSAFFALGRELHEAGDYAHAAAAYQAAVEKGYRVATSLYNQACALSRKGDRAAALDALEKSLEAGFDDPNQLWKDDDLDSIRDEKRFEEIQRTAETLALPGEGPSSWLGRPSVRQRAEWRRARNRFQEYVQQHPGSGRAFFNLGFVELKLEDPGASRAAFSRALELGYRKPTTMYNLACAHARLGQKDLAFEWLFKSLDAGFEAKGVLAHDDDLESLRDDPRFRKARQIAENKDRDEG